MFVSGSIDALAPESNVEALLDGFPNAAHIVAENAGHEPIEMLSAEFRLLLGAFLNGEEVASGRVARPAPKFRWDSLG